jgi:hypothetical protein
MSKLSVWIVLAGLYLAGSHLFEVFVFLKAVGSGGRVEGLWFMIQYGLTVFLPFLAGIFLFAQKEVGFWLLVAYLVIRPLTLITLVNSATAIDVFYIYIYGEMFILVAAFVVWINRHRLEPLRVKKPIGEVQDA